MAILSIGKLSKQSGVSAAALRYYEGLGLILSRARKTGAVRQYNDITALRLKAIHTLQDLGFTLAEIKSLIHFTGGKRLQCARLNRQLRLKRAEIEKELKRYKNLNSKLELAIRQCVIKGGTCRGQLARLLGYAG